MIQSHHFVQGDARRLPLADHSVHCVVTSPPYFNLRDYGGAGQIGREARLTDYVDAIYCAFDEVARVLRPDGTAWLNLGDSYRGGSLLGVPWRVAGSLDAGGWRVRQEVVWSKPNPMPDTATNRPARSHETLFLLTRRKSRYFYDHYAVRRAGKEPTGRSLRTVWDVPVARCKGAHFAVFPPDLVAPCIMAGTSAAGVCPACGAQVVRRVDKVRRSTRPGRDSKGDGEGLANRDRSRHVTEYVHVGWRPGCRCAGFDPIPATVLDPFAGAFTTSACAKSLGRSSVGIDLNADYIALGRDVVRRAVVRAESRKPGGPLPGQMDLFPDFPTNPETAYYNPIG